MQKELVQLLQVPLAAQERPPQGQSRQLKPKRKQNPKRVRLRKHRMELGQSRSVQRRAQRRRLRAKTRSRSGLRSLKRLRFRWPRREHPPTSQRLSKNRNRSRSNQRSPFLKPPRARTAHNSVPITYTSGEQVEVYRFSIPVTIGVPLLALFLQAFIPLRFPRFAVYFDLPLLVTIFFAMARRSPIAGLFTGAFIGLAQDMLGHNPIGIYGIAKTVVGYGASSLGVKLDVENAGARLLVTLGFYLVHSAVYFTVARALVNMTQHWNWVSGIVAGFANAVLGVMLYWVLDKFKQRT